MSKYYAGIGSRTTPPEFKKIFSDIASKLEDKGYVLRSGGASGADSFFEAGVKEEKNKEIYLPWKNFNGNNSKLFTPSKEAIQLASTLHPAWHNLNQGGQKLMARNCYQVMGLDLNTPVDFVLCWTPSITSGGTSQAIRLAFENKILVYNFAAQVWDIDYILERTGKFNKIKEYFKEESQVN